MKEFKANTKMAQDLPCYKEGGSVAYKSRKSVEKMDSADIKQDKAIIKKAFKIHDEQEHSGEHTDLSKLRKGGRAKKSAGSVRKYEGGGSVFGGTDAKVGKQLSDMSKPSEPFGGTDAKISKKLAKGGCVENAYGAKKTDKDIKDIATTKRQKPAKLCMGGKS
jgi:hypothetical protein